MRSFVTDMNGEPLRLGDYVYHNSSFGELCCRITELDHGRKYKIRASSIRGHIDGASLSLFEECEVSKMTEQEIMHFILKKGGDTE
jgi:hypothetical protein